jgi:WD40 repeat protein
VSGSVSRRAILLGAAGAAASCGLARRDPKRIVRGVHIGRQVGALDLAFLRDGVRVVCADTSADGTINVWDLRNRRIERSFRVGRQLSFFALDEDRRLLAVALRENHGVFVRLLDFATGRLVTEIAGGGPLYGVDKLLVTRQGVLTSWADRGLPLASILWSFETGRQIAEFSRPADALARDGRTVLGGRVSWDLVSGRPRGELKGQSVTWGCGISSAGNLAVSVQRRSGILWNDHGEVVRTLDDQLTPISRAAFSPDDRFLITGRYAETFRGDRRLLVLREARTGAFLADLPGHKGFVTSVGFSRDSLSAVSTGRQGELILWKMPGG